MPHRRRAGRPAIISRDEILRVAAEVGLDDLTVQAVARRLGVTRAAVYRYVASTDELRRLTARAKATWPEFAGAHLTDWREWLDAFARALRAWRIANAEVGEYLYVAGEVVHGSAFLEITEEGLGRLVSAGFPEDRAARALHFVVGMVWINTQDQLMAMRSPDGRHPQERELLSATEGLPLARHMIHELGVLSSADERFETELRWVIAALEAELAAGSETG